MTYPDQRFKTMRHIETVRNYLGAAIRELVCRQEQHDQSKLADPERELFDEYTDKLRATTYGSDEYKEMLKGLGVALDHHYANNRHHPEHFKAGYREMTLIDLIEMLADWKSAGLRHHDGDIFKSIEINQKRFGYSDEIKEIFMNTARWLNDQPVFHKAEES
jgi:hypothetical protein